MIQGRGEARPYRNRNEGRPTRTALFCRNCNVLVLVGLALNWKVCVASGSRRKPLLGLAFLWDESERS